MVLGQAPITFLYLIMCTIVTRIEISPFPRTIALRNLNLAQPVRVARATAERAREGTTVAMLTCMLCVIVELIVDI